MLDHLTEPFKKMGVRIKITTDPKYRIRGAFAIDVKKDNKGTFYEMLIAPGNEVDAAVQSLDAKGRHLVLSVKQTAGDTHPRPGFPGDTHPRPGFPGDTHPRPGFPGDTHPRPGFQAAKFLCGHDERDWFAAAVPQKASTVAAAKEALKPNPVIESQVKNKVGKAKRNKRKNKGFIRQGEWFFIPRPKMVVDSALVHKNEPMRRGRSKPHVAENLYRIGGTAVTVAGDGRIMVTVAGDGRIMTDSDANRRSLSLRRMMAGMRTFVKGKVKHPDHATLELPFWHEVVPNTESENDRDRNLVFLD